MEQTAINEFISFFKASLERNGTQVEAIALFGSALTGQIQTDSDIDLIIISPDFISKDIFDRSKMTMAAEIETLKKFKISMDVLNMSREEYETGSKRMFWESRIVA